MPSNQDPRTCRPAIAEPMHWTAAWERETDVALYSSRPRWQSDLRKSPVQSTAPRPLFTTARASKTSPRRSGADLALTSRVSDEVKSVGVESKEHAAEPGVVDSAAQHVEPHGPSVVAMKGLAQERP